MCRARTETDVAKLAHVPDLRPVADGPTTHRSASDALKSPFAAVCQRW
jgi:hypothetical protein